MSSKNAKCLFLWAAENYKLYRKAVISLVSVEKYAIFGIIFKNPSFGQKWKIDYEANNKSLRLGRHPIEI